MLITLLSYSITKEEFLKLSTERVEFKNLHDKKWVNKFAAIASLVPADLKKVFGKHQFVFQGCERRLYNWAFYFKGFKFFVATANERGATVEASGNPDIKTIEEFADGIIGKI